MASGGGSAYLAEPHHGPDTWDKTFACLMSVIFLFVVPWDYVWRNFVAARGDRWW